MSSDVSIEPFFNQKASDEASEGSKRDLRVKSANDPIEGYQPSDDEINDGNDTTNYYGFLRADGAWYIQKEVRAGTLTAYTYAKGDSGYDFSDRANATYASFDTTF